MFKCLQSVLHMSYACHETDATWAHVIQHQMTLVTTMQNVHHAKLISSSHHQRHRHDAIYGHIDLNQV